MRNLYTAIEGRNIVERIPSVFSRWLTAACLACLLYASMAGSMPARDVAMLATATGARPLSLAPALDAGNPVTLARSGVLEDSAARAPGAVLLAQAVPEPTTIALLAIALLAVFAILRYSRWRQRRPGRRNHRSPPPDWRISRGVTDRTASASNS